MEVKQTAVNWVIKKFAYQRTDGTWTTDGIDDVTNIVIEAKEMEEEQMQLFYTRGVDDLYNDFYHSESFEKHYKETFKSE